MNNELSPGATKAFLHQAIERRVAHACRSLPIHPERRIIANAFSSLSPALNQRELNQLLLNATLTISNGHPAYQTVAMRLKLYSLYDELFDQWVEGQDLRVPYIRYLSRYFSSLSIEEGMDEQILADTTVPDLDESLSIEMLQFLSEGQGAPILPQALWWHLAIIAEQSNSEREFTLINCYRHYANQRIVPAEIAVVGLLGTRSLPVHTDTPADTWMLSDEVMAQHRVRGITEEEVNCFPPDDGGEAIPHKASEYVFTGVDSVRKTVPAAATRTLVGINLTSHLRPDGELDTSALRESIELVVAIQSSLEDKPQAFAVLGYRQTLTLRGITPGSHEEFNWSDQLFERIAYHAWCASLEINQTAINPGQGGLVLDQLRRLEAQRHAPFSINLRETLPWLDIQRSLELVPRVPVLPVRAGTSIQYLLAGLSLESEPSTLLDSDSWDGHLEALARRQKWTPYSEHLALTGTFTIIEAADLLVGAWKKGLGMVRLRINHTKKATSADTEIKPLLTSSPTYVGGGFL